MLPATTPFRKLVDFTKLRRTVERDYEELKQQIGLSHYEEGAAAASITTPRCASQLTASSSPSRRQCYSGSIDFGQAS
ncbi:Hypothetical protein; Putative transposase (fragment) [Bradyrhizobium sp. ORS 285]